MDATRIALMVMSITMRGVDLSEEELAEISQIEDFRNISKGLRDKIILAMGQPMFDQMIWLEEQRQEDL